MNRDKEMKEWYKRWVNAKRKQRDAHTYYERVKWCDIAIGISLGFVLKFGVDFATYFNEMCGSVN